MKNQIRFGLITWVLLTPAIVLHAADAAPGPDKTAWQISAALGLSVTKGNSDTLLFTANVQAGRKWAKNEVSLGADAAYGENNSAKNVERYHAFAQYNRLLTERLYTFGRADFLRDTIADLGYRVTLSPGFGYYFIKDEKSRLSGEAGPGFVFERQGNANDNYVTLRLAERFEHKFTAHTRLWQAMEFLPQVDDFNNYIINAEIGLETDLTDKMSLRTFLQDTYDNVPAPGRKKNDLKLVTAIAYKF